MAVNRIVTPVPAIPLKPPPLNLVASGNVPADSTNARWTGGFAYLPESRAAGVAHDGVEFTVVDLPALATPAAPTAVGSITGGTLAAGTFTYKIVAKNGNGQTLAGAAGTATIASGTTGKVVLTWTADPLASSYDIYGRTTFLKIGNVVDNYVGDDNPPTLTFTDTGAVTPAGAVPSTNTTGGPGVYTPPSIVTYYPWLVMVEDACSTFGFEEHDYIGRASRLLDVATPSAIESELWTGALSQAKGYPNNYLTNTTSTTYPSLNFVDLSTGTPPSITRGIQLLEDFNANTGAGGQAMIHLQPECAPSLLNARRVGNLLMSELDNIIVPGSGYPGTGPAGVAPGTGFAYIYITDLINVRLDEPTITPDNFAEALDWGQADQPNTLRFRAQRFVAADWAGLVHACVKVALAS